MEYKFVYEKVDIEIVNISSDDIIVTSPIGSGNDIDKNGWTTITGIEW